MTNDQMRNETADPDDRIEELTRQYAELQRLRRELDRTEKKLSDQQASGRRDR